MGEREEREEERVLIKFLDISGIWEDITKQKKAQHIAVRAPSLLLRSKQTGKRHKIM